MKTAAFVDQFPEIEILKNEPLAKYTNTKTGGPAELLAFPNNSQQLRQLVVSAQQANLELTVLGNASNLIVRDGGLDGLVIILQKMNKITCSANQVIAEAGAAMIRATEVAWQNGLTGLEFAAGIPGSVGGAIFMNAGAYGGEVGQVVENVKVIDRQGNLKTYSQDELHFSYRHSRIQDEDDLVIEAVFSLKSGQPALIRAKMDDLNFRRAAKQPLEYPSCGSVFKRPKGYYTGKLIHDAKLQGYRVGDAQVSLKHAGFIVNLNHATADDYLAVIQHVQAIIWQKFQVRLETEVRIIGKN
ncbi:UDP-N-acetylmuramate dehydrogenase [Liquorilactobacillus sicerae]|uniref:UDP-N-acetylmuramate dehydrogenase n=1 Tax=Liquorilactobacillus sicerae TaxID=1416943 RepID=UPI003D07930A